MNSWNLLGKTFVTGSWSNPSTSSDHGTHVAVSSIEVTWSRHYAHTKRKYTIAIDLLDYAGLIAHTLVQSIPFLYFNYELAYLT